MKSTTFLIVLFHSSKNIGDRAILEATIKQIYQSVREPKITVVANYPDEPYFQEVDFQVTSSPWVLVGKTNARSTFYQLTRLLIGIVWALLSRFFLIFLTGLPSIIPIKWRQLFNYYIDSDIILGAGGNQFYSSGKFGWPFPLNVMMVWLAHLFNKPYYALPQSIGPLNRKWEKTLITKIYNKNRITFIRDNKSRNLANNLGLKCQIQFAPDLAFSLINNDTGAAGSIFSKYGENVSNNNIGMTIIAPMGLALDARKVNQYYSILADLIEIMINTLKCHIYIFCQVSGPSDLEDDRLANKIVENKVDPKYQDQIHIINEVYSPEIQMSLYEKMDLFIASRLHSGIFSINKKVPTVFIGYLSKTIGMLESIGLENWGISLNELSYEILWELIKKAWGQRDEIKASLSTIIPQTVLLTEGVMMEIVEDYEQYFKAEKHDKKPSNS